MKRLSLLLLSAPLLLASGCATENYVRMQTAPLADRLTALEQKVAGIETKLNKPTPAAGLTDADKALLNEARDMALKAKGSADQAAASAKDAEAAAKQADLAAKKGAKMFELEQKK